MYNYCRCLTEDRLNEHRVCCATLFIFKSARATAQYINPISVQLFSVRNPFCCQSSLKILMILVSWKPREFWCCWLWGSSSASWKWGYLRLMHRLAKWCAAYRKHVVNFKSELAHRFWGLLKTTRLSSTEHGLERVQEEPLLTKIRAGILTKTHWCQRPISCCLLAKPKPMDQKDWRIEIPTSIRRPGVPTRSSAPASHCDDNLA